MPCSRARSCATGRSKHGERGSRGEQNAAEKPPRVRLDRGAVERPALAELLAGARTALERAGHERIDFQLRAHE
ncbi:MAG: hypothetical protein ACREFU_19110, partial [Acetobacteraceae bacterium]